MQAANSPQLTVERGLGVLRAFRSERAPLSNAELVRRTGLPKATVSRLTSTMLQLGFLRHAAGGREFELAPAPVAIGHAFLGNSDVLSAANPILRELADTLNVSVALGVRDQMEMVYVAYQAGKRVCTLRMGVGAVLPMGRTAMGHAYLWTRPHAEREALVRSLVEEAGEHRMQMEEGIRHSFADLDRTGTCFAIGMFQRGACALARPVVAGRDRSVMVMSCGLASLGLDASEVKRRIAPQLIAAGAKLETALADCAELP
jgi:DNA-binding IclR family transcriptional regulator